MNDPVNDIASAVAEAAKEEGVRISDDDVVLDMVADDAVELEDAPEIKAEEAAEETPTGEESAAEEVVEEILQALEAPEHWNEDYRAAFSKVDPETQQSWLAQQKDFQRGFDSMSQEYKQYKERLDPFQAALPLLNQAIPHWQAQGMNVEQGLGQILQWGYALAQNPQETIPQIAKLYGIELSDLASEQPYLTPDEKRQQTAFAAQNREMSDLRGRVEQQELDRRLDFIGSFRNETGADGNLLHPHFDKVQAEITRMFKSGFQGDLNNAYEQAIWTNPEVRSELIKSEQSGAVEQVVQQSSEEARRAESKARQRVRHAQPGTAGSSELDEMTTEQLVAHLAQEQEAAAAR